MNTFKSLNSNFQFFFFNMGDGKSCLIKCPDEALVVVDFGSNDKVSVVNTKIMSDGEMKLYFSNLDDADTGEEAKK